MEISSGNNSLYNPMHLNVNLSNSLQNALLRQSTASMSHNFNVLISNIISDISLPINSSAFNPIVIAGDSVSNGPTTFNRSLLEMFSTITSDLPSDETQLDQYFEQYSPRTPEGESWVVTLIWSVLFYPLVLLGAFANLLVIWIISTKPLMRTVMNRYLLNLTVSDFLSIFFNCGFFFYMMINEHWPFGKLYCIVNNFIANLTLASSISTLSLISLDRFYAIVHPLRPRQTHRRLLFSIGAIWFFSALFSLPTLLYSDTMEVIDEGPAEQAAHLFSGNYSDGWYISLMSRYTLPSNSNLHEELSNITSKIARQHFGSSTMNYSTHSTRTLCILQWPDGISGFSRYEFIYNLAFLILFYVVPLFTMVVALVLMSRVLWPGERIGEPTIPQHALIRSKRKVVCMLICVITVFASCWLPYHAYFLSIYLWPSLIQTFGIKHIFLAFYWLAMSNSLLNIIILFAMNRRIRNYILQYLKFTCCLFRLQKRFSRTCRRSSMQIMMKPGGSQKGEPNSAARQMSAPNCGEMSARMSHCKHRRCDFSASGNSHEETVVRGNGSSRPIGKNARYSAIHQEGSSSSANSQGNVHLCTSYQRHMVNLPPNESPEENGSFSHLNYSCPPVMCTSREIHSLSSFSHCFDQKDRSSRWTTICRCASESGPSDKDAKDGNTPSSCSMNSFTQNHSTSQPANMKCVTPRFRLFRWRKSSPICSLHNPNDNNPLGTVSIPLSSVSISLHVQQGCSPFRGHPSWNERGNTAL